MPKEKALFNEEAIRHVEEFAILLRKFKEAPGDLKLADRLYHTLRSIKVLCSVLGLKEMMRLFLYVLTFFDHVRHGDYVVSDALMDRSFALIGHIKKVFEAEQTGNSVNPEQTLALIAAWESLETPQLTTESKAGPKKPSVLIVDDEYINRSLLEELIRSLRNDIRIVSVDSAEEALYYYFTNNFDLVLLDIMMPSVSGNDFITIVEKNRRLGHLTSLPNIVVQTGIHSLEHLLTYARKESVLEVIRKPISSERIRECLERYCPA